MTKTCENCQWAKQTGARITLRGPYYDKPIYECHLNPPPPTEDSTLYTGCFPTVRPDDYCSHFQPREASK
jgi:hypothetical protein